EFPCKSYSDSLTIPLHSLCPLCLCGCFPVNHRGTETQRSQQHKLLFAIDVAVSILRFECRHLDFSELLIDEIASFGGCLSVFEKLFEARRVSAFDHAEARLVAHIVGHLRFRWSIVEVQRRLTIWDAARIEAVKRPDSGFDREFLLGRALGHVVAVGDAMTV